MKTTFAKLGLTALALVMAGQVQASETATSGAQPPYYLSFNINSPNYAIQDIAMFEYGNTGQGITWFTPGLAVPQSSSPTTIGDPFLKTDVVNEEFLLGVTSGLPGDAPGQQHLVVFTNNAWANSAQHIAFGELFPNTLEESLISDLEGLGSGSGDTSAVAAFQGYDNIFGSGGDAITGPNGNITFGVNDSFSLVAFSDGQIIGSGTSFTTPAASAVPEPATWGMMLLGFGLLGVALRRKRVTKVQFA